MSKLSDISSPPILIPIVLPHSGDTNSGRVRNLPVSPQAVPRMLERRSGGAYGIKGSYAEKGYALLRDLYVAERNDAGWARYERYLKLMDNGTTRHAFPVAELPAEVRRRQAEPMALDEFADDFAPAIPVKSSKREGHT